MILAFISVSGVTLYYLASPYIVSPHPEVTSMVEEHIRERSPASKVAITGFVYCTPYMCTVRWPGSGQRRLRASGPALVETQASRRLSTSSRTGPSGL